MNANPISELQTLATDEATGEFICASATSEVHVYLQRGRVAWATTSTHPLEFIRHLRAHHAIDDDTLRDVLETCRRERRPVGETLVAFGLVGWGVVRDALRHQIALAMSALDGAPTPRTMFLPRRRFLDYDASLTVELGAVLPAEQPGRPPPSVAPRLAAQLHGSLDGARWVEVYEGSTVIDAAPEPAAAARVRAPLLRAITVDSADFLGVRTEDATLVGARVSHDERSVWCSLAPSATFGAAVSALWSLSLLRPPAPERGRERQGQHQPWSIGATETTGEVEEVIERAREVVAVIVLRADAPLAAVARGGLTREYALALVARRRELLSPDVASSAERRGAGGPGAAEVAGRFRAVVSGEPELWCFGAALAERDDETLWVLTERSAAQGLGWACLAALSRGWASR